MKYNDCKKVIRGNLHNRIVPSSTKVTFILVAGIMIFAGCLGPDDGWGHDDEETGWNNPRATELELEFVSSILPGEVYDVAVKDDYVFMAVSMGMMVVNVSDSSNPTLTNFLSLPEGPQRIEIFNNYVFLAGYPNLWVFDISEPAQPELITTIPNSGRDIALAGDYLYIIRNNALSIIDISNPTQPIDTNVSYALFQARSVGASEGYVFLGSVGGFTVIDVGDIRSPTWITDIDTGGLPIDIEVKGNYAYVVSTIVGLNIIDISNPQQAKEVSSYGAHSKSRVSIEDDFAYLVDSRSIQILNISDPINPSEIIAFMFPFNGDTSLTVSGQIVYVADSIRGLLIFNLTNPSNPKLSGLYELSGIPHDLVIEGDYAYVATGSGGLHLLDISDKINLSVLSFIDTPGNARSLVVNGDFAYIADETGGFRIVNISNRTNLSEAGNVTISGPAWDLTVEGEYAYVVAREGGLHIFHIIDPYHPEEAGYLDTPGNASAIAVSDGYAYIADISSGLLIINVSNPANPFIETIYDLTKPANYGNAREAHGVTINGDLLYVALNGGGVQTVDVSNPKDPKPLRGYYRPPEFATSVFLSGKYMLASHWWEPLQLINLSYPYETAEFTDYHLGSVAKASMVGDYIYLLTGSAFIILRLNPPPKGKIEVTAPTAIQEGESIIINGSGIDSLRKISGFEWHSNLDGFLSNQSFFTTANLSIGNHTIFFQVQNEKGVWSHPETINMTVSEKTIIR